MAVLYLEVGENEKGEKMLDKVAQNCCEYLQWGESLDRDRRQGVMGTIQHQGAVLGYVLQNAQRYHLNDLIERYGPIYEAYN